MKVIDLFIKIANGEEVPEKVKYCDLFWVYEKRTQDYIYKKNGITEKYLIKDVLSGYEQTKSLLDCEIEIIEEDKKIEKIEKANLTWLTNDDNEIDKIRLINKINEIIDAINELKKGE